MTEIRILLADYHPLFREGVAVSLAKVGGFAIVGEAGTADEAVELAMTTAPDIVLLDLSMPGGLSALRRIVARENAPRVAILTGSEDDDDVMRALESGAMGCVLKAVGAQELCEIVRDLAEDRSHVTPAIAARILVAMGWTRAASPIADLTKREDDILNLVSQGMSNREIGARLQIHETTAKHHITAILQKLQVRNRTEAEMTVHDHWRSRHGNA